MTTGQSTAKLGASLASAICACLLMLTLVLAAVPGANASTQSDVPAESIQIVQTGIIEIDDDIQIASTTATRLEAPLTAD